MTSIRLTQFAGLMPELSAKLKRKDNAQIAHNCLLYDGRLRAMPAYLNYNTYSSGQVLSLYRAYSSGPLDVYPDFEVKDAIFVDGAPFPRGVYGYNQYTVIAKYGDPGISGNLVAVPVGPANIRSVTLTVVPVGQTARPTTISYAVTVLRDTATIEESAPTFLGTVGHASFQPLYYDGDAVQIFCQLAPLANGENRARIYRTITGIETGEQLNNNFDTDWFLVVDVPISASNPVISYTDIALASQLQGDLLLSEGNLAPLTNNVPIDVGLTEGGWFWAITRNDLQFSERYHWHAWSISGYTKIPDADIVRGAVAFYDTIYVGTSSKPYKATVAFSNEDVGNIDPISVNLAPYPENQPCIGRTIVTAPFGALYTSVNGVIALEDNRMQVITKDLLNGGDKLYQWYDQNGVLQTFHFADITFATWFNGWYIGYAGDKAFVYEAPEDLNDAHAFQQLITMDIPDITSIRPCSVVGSYGLHFSVGLDVYYWPVPGWVQGTDKPTKLRYKWKSKKFVMPGNTNFAAGKVVWECDGDVCFRMYVDCIQVFETRVTDCQPFRLPTSTTGIEFEIELEGTGTVSEAHIASSMKELVEVETE